MQQIITSRDNPQIKLLVGLTTRKKERDETGCFALEGLRLCVDAANSGVVIRTLFLTETAAGRCDEVSCLTRAAARTLVISQALAAKISDTKTPQGVFAICEKLDICRCAVKIKSGGRYILLAGLQDPGNLGTVLRTADALGIDGVYLSEGCPDLYSPKVLRGSMGGVFRLAHSVCGDLLPEIARIREGGIPVWAAALGAQSLPAGQVDFSAGGAVAIGNEGNGLPEAVLSACTGRVRIPMVQGANSLNAAVAAGILMWEMCRINREEIGHRH